MLPLAVVVAIVIVDADFVDVVFVVAADDDPDAIVVVVFAASIVDVADVASPSSFASALPA